MSLTPEKQQEFEELFELAAAYAAAGLSEACAIALQEAKDIEEGADHG